jgi:hypothetical protein
MASARIGLDGQGISLRKATLTGGAFPNVDPDALAWFSAVEATGSTITPTNKTAFNTAFLALKSNNIWDKITQGCFFVGIDGDNPLTGAFTPFKSPVGIVPANTNFTTSDYNRLTGIVVDGGNTGSGVYKSSTKSINTLVKNRDTSTVDNPNFPLNNRHLLVFNSRSDLTEPVDVGGFYESATSGRAFRFRLNGYIPQNTNWQLQNSDFQAITQPSDTLDINNGSKGFSGIQWIYDLGTGYKSGRYFFESQPVKFDGTGEDPEIPATTGVNTGNIIISPPGGGGKKRIAYYSLGFGLNDIDGDRGQGAVDAYNSIINTLLSSLV